jgi:hypothetical protein
MNKIGKVLLLSLLTSCAGPYTMAKYSPAAAKLFTSDSVFYTDAIITNANFVLKGGFLQIPTDSFNQSADVKALFKREIAFVCRNSNYKWKQLGNPYQGAIEQLCLKHNITDSLDNVFQKFADSEIKYLVIIYDVDYNRSQGESSTGTGKYYTGTYTSVSTTVRLKCSILDIMSKTEIGRFDIGYSNGNGAKNVEEAVNVLFQAIRNEK